MCHIRISNHIHWSCSSWEEDERKKETIKPVWMTNRPSASDFLLLSLLFCLSHSRRGTSVLYDCKCKFSKQKRKQKQKYHKIIDYVIKCSGIPCVHFAFTLAVSRALYRHQCLICFVPQSQATLSKKLINILCVCISFLYISNKKIKFIGHKNRRTIFTCTNDSIDVHQFVSSFINVLSSSFAIDIFFSHFVCLLLVFFFTFRAGPIFVCCIFVRLFVAFSVWLDGWWLVNGFSIRYIVSVYLQWSNCCLH